MSTKGFVRWKLFLFIRAKFFASYVLQMCRLISDPQSCIYLRKHEKKTVDEEKTNRRSNPLSIMKLITIIYGSYSNNKTHLSEKKHTRLSTPEEGEQSVYNICIMRKNGWNFFSSCRKVLFNGKMLLRSDNIWKSGSYAWMKICGHNLLP